MIDVTRDGGIATLWLARGGARNALPIAGWRALAERVAELAASDVRAVLIASREPGIFSAGADIAEFADLRDDPARRAIFRETLSAAIEGVARLPMPVIAAVDGGCFGAAVALALACDLIVAGKGARFAIPPARLGILYPPADVARLVAAVGRGQAARLLYTGDAIDADEAVAIGLAHRRSDSALAAAQALAARIAANAPGAVRGLKLAIDGVPGGEARFDAAFGDAELVEGLAAFHDRRPPEF
ncbi:MULTISPECIES: enoyl-CoA hydratase/isomerase family protein [unclassified Sphingomonas]|uniref:enoyl-CoA hydratase/isomerase family protein n=1 Tax=unclassified Sphingomonas TaxID=196159 RepID=UPI0006F938C8|nr:MULTISPECIES: enoyl-CoA hydratase/isomerase family protein [unclassified Sphingomonas]KQM66715.1 enoyl-CoA hydratase [Sphingomonas sp. Leaf16]KQN17663.1 enoyl-CoA hydratase [Sphingomonas sp. Leaf29]KQN23528.1 enoyl-CoA hydratase [Sphingomonas sp. Leaf32]